MSDSGTWALIVDDDAVHARALARFLGRWVACEAVTTVEEALRIVERPALVGALVDIRLGGLLEQRDGIEEVAVPLKALHPNADVRLMTGQSEYDADVRRAGARGFFFTLKGDDLEPLSQLGASWREIATRLASDDAIIERRLEAITTSRVLTAVQARALSYAVRGHSYRQIGTALGTSRNAVYGLSARMRNRTGKTLHQWALQVCEGTGRRVREPSDGGEAEGGEAEPDDSAS